MPYKAHFGLRRRPFSLTPDTGLFFQHPGQARILEALVFASRRGEGIIKVTGEIGTGKTMLCRMLLKRLVGEMDVAYLNAPRPDAEWIRRSLCREFNLTLKPDSDAVAELNRYLIRAHEQGRCTVIVVDEAQALGQVGLEEIRRLSNLETETDKLLQIILFGQPELDRLLGRHNLRQLLQRISFRFATAPLSAAESRQYLRHRLCRVAWNPHHASKLLPRQSLHLLTSASGGVPRLLNLLTDHSLIAAYAAGCPHVLPRHIHAVLAEHGRKLPGLWRWSGWRFWQRYRFWLINLAILVLTLTAHLLIDQSWLASLL